MKDFPSYTPIIYYYSDKTKRDKFKDQIDKCCGSLIYTENNTFYFNPYQGGYIIPDSIADDGCIVPGEWFNIDAIKYAIDFQPFDNKDSWLIATSMYSKDLFYNILSDIRDIKLKILNNEFNIQKWKITNN